MVILLPCTAMPSWALANSLRLAAQHHVQMAAAGHDFLVTAPSLRTAAPHMRFSSAELNTGAVFLALFLPQCIPHTAPASMNPAFLALDALAVLIKVAWRLAVAAGLGLAFKESGIIQDFLNVPFITKYARRVRLVHLKLLVWVAFYPYAFRAVRLVLARIFPRFDATKFSKPRRARRPKRTSSPYEPDGDGDGGGDGGGDKGGGGGGDGDGGGSEGGGDRSGGDGGGSVSLSDVSADTEPAATEGELLAEAAKLLAACPFASDAVRDEWLEVTALPDRSGVGSNNKGQSSAKEMAEVAHRRQRKDLIMNEASPEARAVLKHVLQLKKEARTAKWLALAKAQKAQLAKRAQG
jgi:hypothetical protein